MNVDQKKAIQPKAQHIFAYPYTKTKRAATQHSYIHTKDETILFGIIFSFGFGAAVHSARSSARRMSANAKQRQITANGSISISYLTILL